MQKLVQCSICSLRIAAYNCKSCGRSVCQNCYDKAKGICISCRQGRS